MLVEVSFFGHHQREGESGVTENIIDELHTSDIQAHQMVRESGVTRSIIDEYHSSIIQGYQSEVESGVFRSTIDELHPLDMIKEKGKAVLLELSFMNFILGISRHMKL